MLSLFTLVTLLAALLTGCSSDSGKDEVDESAPPTSEAQAARPTDDPVSVLIVHSYHADLTWEKELEDGILRGLGEGGYSET
ncbi:MAG: hypothetical protein GXY36_04360, partial [Chloroflexi bacterium]|nr:hypothetical protein [Chloroflexota bacterium]